MALDGPTYVITLIREIYGYPRVEMYSTQKAP